MSFDELAALEQYSLPQREKEAVLLEQLNELTAHHRAHCPEFDRLIGVLHPGYRTAGSVADLPYLPVGLFKSHRLQSVPDSEVFKVLTSSGTTGQQPSRICLDRETARRQTVALSRIMTHVLGPQRLPMILVESADLIRDRGQHNARAAGLLGMMNFGRSHFYALRADMGLDLGGLHRFLEAFGTTPFLIFGFTFLAWTKLLAPLRGAGVDLSNGILIHSGGWKKLQQDAVSREEFRRQFREETGLRRMYDFYGMAEQVGSVFLEGEDGYLYAPNFGDVLIRDPRTFAVVGPGEPGLIQVLSVLPRSYPGHSLLTEDLGVIHAVDGGGCGRKGKAFSVLGRIPKSELRGCSDVIAVQSPP